MSTLAPSSSSSSSSSLGPAARSREPSAITFHLNDPTAAATASTSTHIESKETKDDKAKTTGASELASPSQVTKSLLSATYATEGKTKSSSTDAKTSSDSSTIEMQSLSSSPTAATRSTSPLSTSRDVPPPYSASSSQVNLQKEGWFARKEGWNRPVVLSAVLFFIGLVDWVIPLFIPGVVISLMHQQVCDKLCVPIPAPGWTENLNNPDDWKINNFLQNSNRSWWPAEYFTVYLFHVSNSDNVIAGRESKLIVQQVGPYVFQTYRKKYNVSFSDNNEQIFYQDLVQYTFMPNMSVGKLTDKITTINLPLVSINTMEWNLERCPMISTIGNLCTADGPSCLFQKGLTVQQILFGSTSNAYQIAQILQKGLAPQFQMFFNYSTNTTLSDKQHLYSTYGMGGKVHHYDGQFLKPIAGGSITGVVLSATGPSTVNDSLLSAQYTGQGGSYSQMFTFSQFQGNTSLSVWNGQENITGTDHFQFTPPLTPDSVLTVWDDDVMRAVDLQFLEKVRVIGAYDAYRFTPTSDLFSGTNPHFFGQAGYEGTLFVGPVSQIHYSATVSAYASRPYQAGVNSSLANTVVCSNCPDMTNSADWLDVYVDVEPNTGKVLGGKKRGQINALIGQKDIYANFTLTSFLRYVAYQNLSLSLVPVVYFEYSSEVEFGDQTSQLEDGLDQIKLAKTATAVTFYLMLPLSILHFFGAFIIAMKADEKGACCSDHHSYNGDAIYTAN